MAVGVGWVWLMPLMSHGWASTINMTSAYSYNDKCSNQCHNNDNDNSHWCGQRRMDEEGLMSSCVQYTRYGIPCVGTCQYFGEKYRWYMTNAVAYGSNYWNYCSLEGRVKPLQLTIKGLPCSGECDFHGKDYTWCSKKLHYCKSPGKSGTSCPDWWDYCSKDNMHTRYGAQCKDSCSTRGLDYSWCHTLDGWDYCSPKAEEGIHISLKMELDIYGNECIDLCDTHGYKYFWCKSITRGSTSGWEYCSKENLTIYNAACKDSCARRGQSYHWCHTGSSWDYCSPSGYTAGANTATSSMAILALAIIAQCAAHHA